MMQRVCILCYHRYTFEIIAPVTKQLTKLEMTSIILLKQQTINGTDLSR